MEKTEQEHNFLFYSLTFGFSFLLFGIVFLIRYPVETAYVTSSSFGLIMTYLWFLATPFTFVVSILHLKKIKQKTFAIIALIVSSLSLLILLSILLQ